MTARSRSAKLAASLAPKYSFPILRPPTIATCPSAMNDLLCIRRLVRREVGDDAEHAERTDRDGIEHPHLDVGMTVDGEQHGVGRHRAEIVEQQAHLTPRSAARNKRSSRTLPTMSLFQVKYCTSRLRSAASARTSRAARASRPSANACRPDWPGCAATCGRTAAANGAAGIAGLVHWLHDCHSRLARFPMFMPAAARRNPATPAGR